MVHTFDSHEELVAALRNLGEHENLFVALTPKLAKSIQEADPINRKVRQGNLMKLVREIEGGHWDSRKSTAMRFLANGRMNDGQHRSLAVLKTGQTIVVPMCIVPDTLGVDEGAGRTLVDHLKLGFGLSDEVAGLASSVIKALDHTFAASNREWLQFFLDHRDFIMESVTKPLGWLADQSGAVTSVFKANLIVVIRARAIFENHEPAESVDMLLMDAINNGVTAPEGSPRRALARQFYSAMEDVFRAKKNAKRQDVLKWLLNAVRFERDGVLKNIVTARDKRKRNAKRRAAAAADEAA